MSIERKTLAEQIEGCEHLEGKFPKDALNHVCPNFQVDDGFFEERKRFYKEDLLKKFNLFTLFDEDSNRIETYLNGKSVCSYTCARGEYEFDIGEENIEGLDENGEKRLFYEC